MGTLGTLAVSIIGDQRDFDKSMDNMKKKTQGVGQNLQNMGKNIGRTGKTMTKWVTGPIAGAAGGLLAMGVKMGNTADEILDLESATGMSAEAIQEWRAVADRAGVSTDAVAKASEMLTKSMSRGAEGSADMRIAMDELGLSMDEVREMSPDERMETLITSLQGVEDAGERAELGNRLLRNGYQELAPILDMTEDEMQGVIDGAHESGRVMGRDALENADNFRQGLDELKGEFMGLFNTVMADIMPMLTDDLIPAIKENVIPLIRDFGEMVGRLIEWFANLDPRWQKMILGAIGLAAALGPILMVLGPIISAVGSLITFLPMLGKAFALLTGPIGLIIAAIAAAVAIGWYLYNNWEEVSEYAIELWESIKEFFIELWDSLKEWFFELLEGIAEFFRETWDSLKEWFFELLEGIAEFFRDTWESIKEFFIELWDSLKEWFFELLEGIAEFFRDTWESIKEFFEEWWNAYWEFWKGIWTGLRDWFSELWGNIRDNTIDFVQSMREGIEDAFRAVIDWARERWNAFKEFMGDVWEGISGLVKGGVNGVLASVESMINGAISMINSFIRTINRRIRGLNRVPGVNIPTIGTLSKVSLPRLARGGLIGEEGWAMVGERGPEAVRLPEGAQVYPNSQTERMGKSVTIENINFYSPEPISPSKAAKLQEKTLRRLGLEWGLS